MSDSIKRLRNVLILLGLAAIVTFAPGGGNGAALVGAILSIVFAGGLAMVAARYYQEHRYDLYALGDRQRAVLYGSLGGLVLVFAASSRLLANSLGTLVFVLVIALCAFGLVRSFQASRQL
ncbi:MAG: hypothetical protein ACR2ND_08965 [Solirubrobacteraceae bacterium]